MHDLITNFDEAMRYTKFLLDNGIITVEELRASYDERTGRKSTTTFTPAENAESPVETITDAEAGSEPDTIFSISEASTKVKMSGSFIDNLKIENHQVSTLETGTFNLDDGAKTVIVKQAGIGYVPLYLNKNEDGTVTVSVFSIFK